MASKDGLGRGLNPYSLPPPELERSLAGVCPGNRQTEIPLSFAQERIWFLDQLHPACPLNNVVFRLELNGTVDSASIEAAANQVLRRHTTLRTRYLKRDGKPVALVGECAHVTVTETDLTSAGEGERASLAEKIVQSIAREPIDLSSGRLIRLQLLRLAPEQHWLITATHKIAADETSMFILHRDLAATYNGAALPPLKGEYGDWARSQRDSLDDEHLNEDLIYWRQQLGGKLPVLDLPADHPRPPVQTYKGGAVPITISGELSRRLEDFAHQEGVTLQMLLLAVFHTLLHRLSGQEDLVVGTTCSGRAHPTAEGMVGLFSNLIALRVRASGETPFCELLERMRDTVLNGYAHQRVPFEKLIHGLSLERDVSRPPVFQVMFNFQNTPDDPLEFGPCVARAHQVHTCTSAYDMTLALRKQGGLLEGYLEYNSDLFDCGTAERFSGHFQILLESAIERRSECVGKLPLLTTAERDQILSGWNATETPLEPNPRIHELFEIQAKRTPNAVAAIFEDDQVTYDELNRRANAVAWQLRTVGIGADRTAEFRVGICVHRSIEMLVGMLGILKSGAAYVPLDPAYPKDRLAFMINDARVDALLTERELAGAFKLDDGKVLVIEEINGATRDSAPDTFISPEDLAYVIYTSGSTGTPKGVMVRHRNVTNFFAGMDRVLGTEAGVWLAVTSICFDISVLELLWTITRGFAVVIQSDEAGMRSPAGKTTAPQIQSSAALFSSPGYTIAEQIRRRRVTHFQCTPSLMGMLLQEKGAREAVTSVDTILLGGEALTPSLVQQLESARRIINMYGPTETTVWSTSAEIRPGSPITIGHPIANTKIYILDQLQQPVPIGVPGEVFIGGAGVVRGYLNRPELTAERFVPDLLSGGSGETMYRTGDLARYRADGSIEYLGRLDHQVKLRGFRIELGEIETALRQCAGVREAVVVVREFSATDKRLAAYIVGEASTAPITLRQSLKDRLPDYMIPASFTFLDEMPLTPNGKIDRNALPQPAGLRSPETTQAAIPKTEAERIIAGIWSELLQVPDVGLNENFFDLGGHSLLMVQAQARISSAFGVEIPILRLFQAPTVSTLARMVGEPTTPRRIEFDKIRARAQRQRDVYAGRPVTEIAA